MPTTRTFVHLLLSLLAACASAPSLPPETAPLLRQALDGEALYTVAGGLKPVSEGFWHAWIDVAAPDLSAVASTRSALAAWRTEALWADVHVMHEAHDGKRAARAYVVDRAALAALLQRERPFFAPYGLLPDTHPAEVLAVVERLPKLDRHRGQGLLFGYPQHAIDFFVQAAAERGADAPVVPRRFVDIPTFGSAKGRFVYAVAADAAELPADRELAAAAAQILDRYRALRPSDSTDADGLQQAVRTLRAEFAGGAATRATQP